MWNSAFHYQSLCETNRSTCSTSTIDASNATCDILKGSVDLQSQAAHASFPFIEVCTKWHLFWIYGDHVKSCKPTPKVNTSKTCDTTLVCISYNILYNLQHYMSYQRCCHANFKVHRPAADAFECVQVVATDQTMQRFVSFVPDRSRIKKTVPLCSFHADCIWIYLAL